MRRFILLIPVVLLTFRVGAQDVLNLEQCRKLALEHNQKMKMAAEQVHAADDAMKAAFTQYLPGFSINGAYTHMNRDLQLLKDDLFLPVVPYTAIDASTGQLSSALYTNPAVAAATFVINPATGSVVTDAAGNPVFQKYTYLPASATKFGIDNLYVANASLTQPVFTGGKIRELNRIARYTKEIAENNLTLTQNELIYSLEEAYWRVVSLKEKVKMAEEYHDMLVRLVSDLEAIQNEGIITNNDLLKAKLKLSESELMMLKARNGMELSKMALCQMIGVPYTSTLQVSDTLNSFDPSLINYTVDQNAISGRPEVKILENNVAIAQSGVNVMISRFLPDVALNAGYTFTNPNPYNGLEKEFGGDWNVGVVASVPLFHFGERLHTYAAARHEQTAAEMKLEESRELMVLQLQQAVYQYTESVKKTDYANMALDQAKKNLDFVNDNYNEGMKKITDQLEAQVLWQKAYSDLIDARTEQQMAVCNLKKVTGKN